MGCGCPNRMKLTTLNEQIKCVKTFHSKFHIFSLLRSVFWKCFGSVLEVFFGSAQIPLVRSVVMAMVLRVE